DTSIADIQKRGELVVGVKQDVPNFGYKDPKTGTCVGLYHGAYIAEVIRSGIQSIPSGQMEAALSQGFTYISAMRLITLPQAFRIILPPLTNQIV
ncbi:ABC transporter permease subunit, partial [Burkholderia contaminans]|nr:ABC transporter permease subunit [Burkholderia contaminans]